MTEEEIYEMGVKPKPKRTKSITRAELEELFAKRDAELLKKVEDHCESCSHHDCDCPQRIDEAKERMDRIDRNTVDLYNTLNAGIEDSESRMDRLDENDELLRQGINKSHEELSAKLEEEHRMREVSDAEIKELAARHEGTLKALADVKEENRRFSKQNLWLGLLAGGCLGVTLIVLAFFMAG